VVGIAVRTLRNLLINAVQAMCDGAISKPFNACTLVEELGRLISQKS
jgi:hypothetical protein